MSTPQPPLGVATGPVRLPVSFATPPARAFVSPHCGSLPFIDGWTFSVTASPWEWAHETKPAGSGNWLVFHSQPFHAYGWDALAPAAVDATGAKDGLLSRFQSVSTDRVSSGTWLARNWSSRTL